MSRLTVLIIILGLTLSACGVRGELKTPPPLWGNAPQDESSDTSKQDTPKKEGDASQKDGIDPAHPPSNPPSP